MYNWFSSNVLLEKLCLQYLQYIGWSLNNPFTAIMVIWMMLTLCATTPLNRVSFLSLVKYSIRGSRLQSRLTKFIQKHKFLKAFFLKDTSFHQHLQKWPVFHKSWCIRIKFVCHKKCYQTTSGSSFRPVTKKKACIL